MGASSGIGAALARALAREGAVLALSARREDALDTVARDCPGACVLPLDVSDAAAWAQAWRRLSERWPAPDLVVFCAADYQPQRAWQLEPAQAGRTVQTNLSGVYYGLCTVLPGMMARRAGGLVLLASVAGYMGLPNATVYGPTKAAMINLAELLYLDLHPHGLGVYLVNPGFVRTPLTAKNDFAMPSLQTPEQAARAILAGLGAGRFEIAFPKRFTLPLKWASMLPYRWRFALLDRLMRPT
ncbi:SDR family NAD(P)-dependent oxidoreductase [Chitinimonas koreensis]|uniref:SDR family NAD(P)-dependent oxidoreductase n=1 Tax=Chitinimonas koreensis TaxID=356302 RepID=UPI00224054D7|nr:SDR family NAD(P)-dependent oxidoreductase [Chitinimonas koreensis]